MFTLSQYIGIFVIPLFEYNYNFFINLDCWEVSYTRKYIVYLLHHLKSFA